MAEYYFEIVDANPPIASGPAELASLYEARQYALRYVGDLLASQDGTFWSHRELTMTVTDERHLALFTVCVTSIDAPAVRDERQRNTAS